MYLLFDVGGTKTRITLSRDGETFEEPQVFLTPANYEEGISLFSTIKEELVGEEELIFSAGSIAASFNRESSMLTGGGSQIKDWLGKPIKKDMEKVLGCPVYMVNDTMMGGLAQAHMGPGKNFSIVAYITVSTGVGGARIVDGKIDRNNFGFEPGRQIIDAGNALCNGWSKKGFLDDYVSGMAIEKNKGTKPENIDDKEFWKSRADLLALGLYNITTMWSPDTIVVGGSVMKSVPFDYLKEKYKEVLKNTFPNEQTVLSLAEFGDEMGLYGALVFVKEYNRMGNQ